MRSAIPLYYVSLPLIIAVILIAAGSILFSGCYTLKQGAVMLGYLGRAVPLESLLEGAALSETGSAAEENRLFVERVRDIRRFAMEELGLRESKNYTKYVELDRDYLAAVVSASAADSFTRHEWWFPVVGAVPYKGFFNVEDARKEAARLRKRGLDVWVRGVDAFSTLGWFRDPLYSYMRNYTVDRLADIIIHELLHATVFIKGQVQFDEELAEFTGTEGARLYVEKTFGPDSEELRQMTLARTDNAAFVGFLRGLAAELDALYKSGAGRDNPGGLPREEILQRKDRIIRAAQERFAAEYDTLFNTENYRGFAELPVNNAYLELYRLYYAGEHYFADLYERTGRDLPQFIAAAKTLKGRGNPREELESALGLR
ncbi:MAG: aminopeptidase [Treponema sp.]|jgi:predicted aminopeptidase|nr:aminopeptidase [Treponema sp.]